MYKKVKKKSLKSRSGFPGLKLPHLHLTPPPPRPPLEETKPNYYDEQKVKNILQKSQQCVYCISQRPYCHTFYGREIKIKHTFLLTSPS